MKILCSACAGSERPGFSEYTIALIGPRACDICGREGDQGRGEIHAVDEGAFRAAQERARRQ